MLPLHRRYTRQPSGPSSIDWTNPLTRDLIVATYPEEGNIFRNMVDNRLAGENAGSPAMVNSVPTRWGRSRMSRGASYNNNFQRPLLAHFGMRGKMTILTLIVPRIGGQTGTRFQVAGGETSGGWAMARLGTTANDYFVGQCVNGASLLSDTPYVVGEMYAVGFTNYGTGVTGQGRQRLYVNGVKQAAQGSYTANFSKVPDYVNIGSTQANQVEFYLVLAWGRELTEAEMADISANPYQLFARQVRMPRPMASSIPGDSQPVLLLGADTVQSSIGTAGALSQIHGLGGASAAQAATSSAGALAQVHSLVGAPGAQANTSSSGALTAAGSQAGAPSTQSNTSSSGALTQTHQLAGAAGTQPATSSPGAIAQAHALAGAGAAQSGASSAGALAQVHALAGAASTQASTSSSGAITLAGLTGSPSTQAATSSAGALGQVHALGGSSSTQAADSGAGEISMPRDPRFARPQLDLAPGPWQSTGPGSLAETISQPGGGPDHIYATSPGSCTIKLGAVKDPGTRSGQIVRYAMYSPTGDGGAIALMQGDRVIAEWQHPTLPTVETVHARELTIEQANSITDYADLRFKFRAG